MLLLACFYWAESNSYSMLARFICYAKKWFAKPGLIEKQFAVLANILSEKSYFGFLKCVECNFSLTILSACTGHVKVKLKKPQYYLVCWVNWFNMYMHK